MGRFEVSRKRKRSREHVYVSIHYTQQCYWTAQGSFHTTLQLRSTHRGIVPVEEGTQEGRGDGPVQIRLRHLIVEDGVVRELAAGDGYRPFDGPSIDDGIATRGQFCGS